MYVCAEKSEFFLHTGNTAKVAHALDVGGREAAAGADDGAHAGAVDHLARAGLYGAAGGEGRGGATGGGGGGVSYAAGSGGRVGAAAADGAGRGVAGDGAAGALALLLDGHLLENGLRLLGGRVDGEHHALAAVAGLRAVEPWRVRMLATWLELLVWMPRRGRLTERFICHDLHGDLGSGDDGVVLVWLEARVHTGRHGVAGSIECGLCDGVVLAHEGEDDHVAHRCLDLGRRVGEACGTADLN